MDGTENPKDALQETVDPSAGEKGTSTETPETSIQKQIDKAVSDALAKAGRDAKTLSELQTKLNAGMTDLTIKQVAWQKKQEEAEEEAVADNMPALIELRERRKKKAEGERKTTELAERESKLTARETELAEIIERDKVLRRTELAAQVAVAKGVSIDGILKGVTLAKDDSREAMEGIAELLPQANPKEPKVFDSGRNKGGGKDLSKLSDEERFDRALAQMRGTTK